MNWRMRLLVLLAALLGALCAPAHAESVARVSTPRAQSTLAAETTGISPGGRLDLVFRQELKDGWHVYWVNPGDSGLPLEFKWSLPPGFEAGEIAYPSPQRIPLPPLVNYGHTGTPTFRVSVQAPANAAIGDIADIRLEATWLICADICVPETGSFALAVPVVEAPLPVEPWRGIGEAARAADPRAFAGEAAFTIESDRLFLALSPAPADGGHFFPYAQGVTEPSAPQRVHKAGDRLLIAMEGATGLQTIRLRSLDGVFVGEDGSAEAISARPAAEPLAARFEEAAAAAAPYRSQGVSMALILAAFVGGALLNLMPCVFPILFIKAAHLAQGVQGGRARRDGALYALGVISTFAALGGALIMLRAAGESVGWGFHLQSPAAVLVSAYILCLVGLNFLGVFTVGESLAGIGPARQEKGDLGAFLAGALAVFVAAPCVGPFLTAPIGIAATAPASAAMAIFLAMGAGLAAPFTALAFSPALAAAMPRPGPWMIAFRRWLALPVFLGATYFFWVLSKQIGTTGFGAALAGAILLGLATFAFERGKSASSWRLAALIAAAGGAIIGGFGLGSAPTAARISPLAGIETFAYDENAVAARRAAGQPVFIDFTAAWCVTCQVNKLTVFSDPAVLDALRDNGVAFAIADWTRRDPAIADALAGFGAAGVPLNVYLPAQGGPVIFDQPLSAAAVRSAVSDGAKD